MLDNLCKPPSWQKQSFRCAWSWWCFLDSGRHFKSYWRSLPSRAQEGFSPAVQNFRRRGNLHGLKQIPRQLNNRRERSNERWHGSWAKQKKLLPWAGQAASYSEISLFQSTIKQQKLLLHQSLLSKRPMTIFVPYGSAFDLFLWDWTNLGFTSARLGSFRLSIGQPNLSKSWVPIYVSANCRKHRFFASRLPGRRIKNISRASPNSTRDSGVTNMLVNQCLLWGW